MAGELAKDAGGIILEERICKILATVLGIEPKTVGPDFSRTHAEDWDSLGHINLVIALEAEFGVTFELYEILELSSVSLIRDVIARKKL